MPAPTRNSMIPDWSFPRRAILIVLRPLPLDENASGSISWPCSMALSITSVLLSISFFLDLDTSHTTRTGNTTQTPRGMMICAILSIILTLSIINLFFGFCISDRENGHNVAVTEKKIRTEIPSSSGRTPAPCGHTASGHLRAVSSP